MGCKTNLPTKNKLIIFVLFLTKNNDYEKNVFTYGNRLLGCCQHVVQQSGS